MMQHQQRQRGGSSGNARQAATAATQTQTEAAPVFAVGIAANGGVDLAEEGAGGHEGDGQVFLQRHPPAQPQRRTLSRLTDPLCALNRMRKQHGFVGGSIDLTSRPPAHPPACAAPAERIETHVD
jgi:hypothetical protein